MKNYEFLIFFGIVILIYSALNYYEFVRGSQSLPQIPTIKIIYYSLFAVLYISFILNILLIRINPSPLSNACQLVGSLWLGALMYFFLAILLIDILRLLNYFLPFFPSIMYQHYSLAKIITSSTVLLTVIIIMIAGYFNASNPVLKKIEITIPKKTGNLEKLKIAAASDIHLRGICRNGFTRNLVDRINSLNPDIVLFSGDILDESVEPVLKYKIGEPLKKIKSKYGIFAITGNHEYIGGINKTVPYLESLGINLLRDSSVLIQNDIYIIGREDRAIKQFAKQTRKPLTELMKNIDKTKPLILLDHQPVGLQEAVQNDIDFQLSGHTHHGQMWPISYITKLIYEVSWGYLKKGNTHYYVSSGYGAWGPPVRTGNQPELLLIELSFIKK